MLSAVKALLRHAFELGYHRVMSEADVLNKRSIGVLTKAGFKLEGTRKHSSFHADGTRRDISVFAVTLDDTEVLTDLA
jgi:RimJ/RimL family protein N-acetyltransferase